MPGKKYSPWDWIEGSRRWMLMVATESALENTRLGYVVEATSELLAGDLREKMETSGGVDSLPKPLEHYYHDVGQALRSRELEHRLEEAMESLFDQAAYGRQAVLDCNNIKDLVEVLTGDAAMELSQYAAEIVYSTARFYSSAGNVTVEEVCSQVGLRHPPVADIDRHLWRLFTYDGLADMEADEVADYYRPLFEWAEKEGIDINYTKNYLREIEEK